jgi:two-component system LytT family sensor kinase
LATSPLSERKFWSAFSACWIIGVILQVQVVYTLGFSFQTAILDSLISVGTLSLACLFMVGSLRYYFPEKNRYVYLVVWSILTASLWSLFIKMILFKTLYQMAG